MATPFKPRMTDPVSGQKMQKGRPVANAPAPSTSETVMGGLGRTGAAIAGGVKKAMSYTPNIQPPPKNSPLGQLGSSLDDLSDTLYPAGKKARLGNPPPQRGNPTPRKPAATPRLPPGTKQRANIVWGDSPTKLSTGSPGALPQKRSPGPGMTMADAESRAGNSPGYGPFPAAKKRRNG